MARRAGSYGATKASGVSSGTLTTACQLGRLQDRVHDSFGPQMAKNKGICAICGQGTRLTFEHVPPKAAGNEGDATIYGIEEWLGRDRQSGKMPGGYRQPRGTGNVSICKACNEHSGKWYVPEFAKFVGTVWTIFQQLPASAVEEADASLEWQVVDFEIRRLRALPVVKQIVASLLALNPPAFGHSHPALVKFVLDPMCRGLPERYRLYMCLFTGPIARFAGVTAQLSLGTGQVVLMTEVAHPPLACLLTIDGKPSEPACEITVWSTRHFDEGRDERLRLIVGFGHTAVPGDYRSRAKVAAEAPAHG